MDDEHSQRLLRPPGNWARLTPTLCVLTPLVDTWRKVVEGLRMDQKEGRVAWLCQGARNTLAALLDMVENCPPPTPPPSPKEEGTGQGVHLENKLVSFLQQQRGGAQSCAAGDAEDGFHGLCFPS